MEPGTKISHYQIAANLGQGGMGVVYRAWDQKLQRTVALKFPSSGDKANPHAARFHQEALAVSALNHPNIATIYDIDDGGASVPGPGIPAGRNTGIRARSASRCGPTDLMEQGLDYAIQLADALAHAHVRRWPLYARFEGNYRPLGHSRSRLHKGPFMKQNWDVQFVKR